jgi:hypothetical protein
MKASTAEWLQDKGQKAVRQPAWVIPMMTVLSLLFILIWIGIVVSEAVDSKSIIAGIGNAYSALFLFLGLINGLITLLGYERKHYYEIIQSQERRIRELEKDQRDS